MVSAAAVSLRDALNQKLSELEEAVGGVSDAEAGQRSSEGEWCAKEVLSHLCGEEGERAVSRLRQFVEEDMPLIGIVRGLPYYTPRRQAMSIGDLLAAVRGQYEEMGGFLAGLSDDQLARMGRVPILKETPLGEDVTLAQWAGAIINFHATDHVGQLRKGRQAGA